MTLFFFFLHSASCGENHFPSTSQRSFDGIDSPSFLFPLFPERPDKTVGHQRNKDDGEFVVAPATPERLKEISGGFIWRLC